MNMLLPKIDLGDPSLCRRHKELVKQLPCCCTSHPNVDAHHLMRTGERGMGMKSPDRWLVPLRKDLHRLLHDGPLDEPEFLAQYGVDGVALARKLWALTKDGLVGESWLDEGRRIIEDG